MNIEMKKKFRKDVPCNFLCYLAKINIWIAVQSHVKISFLNVSVWGNNVMLKLLLKMQVTEVKIPILFSSKCLYCTFSVLLRYTDSGIFKLFLQHKQIYFYCLFTLCYDLVFMCICYLLWTVTFICYILLCLHININNVNVFKII